MKKSIVFLSVLCVVLIGLCGWQARELGLRKQQAVRAEVALEEERRLRGEQETASRYLERRERDWQEKAMQLTALVGNLRSSEAAYATNYARLPQTSSTRPATLTNDAAGSPGGMFGKGMGEMLSKMMKDPSMREMMRAQQKVMLKKMYGPLIADLNLPPEQQQKLNELLLDQQMKTVERSKDIFKDGGMDLKKAGELSKDAEKEKETAIEDLLGPEKFAEFQEYKKTISERMQLGQFKEEMQTAGSPIGDEQAKQMLAVMKEERERYPPAVDKNDPSAVFAEGGMERQIEWQEELNRRVQERLGEILSPEQLKAYGASQQQQLSMQKFGMKMAREMFGKGAAPPAVAPPVEK
ncbi:MAG TPA: hypothetical protein VJ063_20455 [Verrucomicrobiae bacterium]|nr:hypothetical protein [Verrucomicrobiae bacterium]